MIEKESRNAVRRRRALRVRKKIRGTAEKPRLCVFRSNKHIEAQLIDDVNGVTLASCSSVQLKLASGSNIEAAGKVGEALAKKAAEKGITEVVFDRNGYLYHGRVAALADAAREGGLKF
jgi:large subunit ribosomal protein L18